MIALIAHTAEGTDRVIARGTHTTRVSAMRGAASRTQVMVTSPRRAAQIPFLTRSSESSRMRCFPSPG